MLSQAGYKVITSKSEPEKWDVLWAHDFPFRNEFKPTLRNLKQFQKVTKKSIIDCTM